MTGVYDFYNRKVREKIGRVVLPQTGNVITNPEWSRETIVRHLMFSADPKWSSVFSQACTMMLRGLVLKANEETVDKVTQRINAESAKVLCDFIERHNRHTKDILNIQDMVMRNKIRQMQLARIGKGGVLPKSLR